MGHVAVLLPQNTSEMELLTNYPSLYINNIQAMLKHRYNTGGYLRRPPVPVYPTNSL